MNVQGRASASSGANPSAVSKRGPTKIVIWRRKTTRFATVSRRTQGVIPNIRCGPIEMLSPTPAPGVPRQAADPLAQLRELDPRGPGGLGEEAGPRHAGKRIRLQAKDVSLRTQPEVDPRVAPELQRPVRRERQLLELAGERGVEL